MHQVQLGSCDVAIIGGGIAGMVSAVKASQHGLNVIVLERSEQAQYVCNSRMTSGIFHCALKSVTSPTTELAQKITEVTQGQADPMQLQAIADDALKAVRWLQEQGMRFIKGSLPYYDFTLAPPTVNPLNEGWQGRGGDVLLRTLESSLNKRVGQVLRGKCAKELFLEDGICVGVSGFDLQGRAWSLNAKKTIIADGGFQTNLELLKGAISPAPEKVFQRNSRTGMGDGLKMAVNAGAALSELNGFYGHILSVDAFHNDQLWPHLWLDFVAAAGLLINTQGSRFTDEGRGGVSMANSIAREENPLGTWVIADQIIWQERGTINVQAPNPRLIDAGATVHRANELKELSALTQIPWDTLENTILTYNSAVESNRLNTLLPIRTDFQYKAYAILKPPFYAIPVCAGITYTMGGISIDGHARVLNQQKNPIEGLYAVGATTGGLEGGPSVGYVGGLIKSTVMGLRAADFIAVLLEKNLKGCT